MCVKFLLNAVFSLCCGALLQYFYRQYYKIENCVRMESFAGTSFSDKRDITFDITLTYTETVKPPSLWDISRKLQLPAAALLIQTQLQLSTEQ